MADDDRISRTISFDVIGPRTSVDNFDEELQIAIRVVNKRHDDIRIITRQEHTSLPLR